MNVYLVPCSMLNDSHVLSHVILTRTPFQALAICELCPLMIQLDNCIQLENQDSDSSDSKATYLLDCISISVVLCQLDIAGGL